MAPRVYIDIGDVQATDPTPTGGWDLDLWDTPDALWSGTMPNWTEISCRVREVRIDRGRRGVLELFEPGRATITVANPDGWASWSPTSPGPLAAGAWLRVRTDDQVLFTGTVLRILDAYTPAGELAAELVVVDPLARLGQVALPGGDAVGGGDTAADRIGRILDEVGIIEDLRDLEPGGPALTATTLKGSMADQAHRAEITAGGHLFADRDGRICYRGADWLQSDPTVRAVIANDGRPGALCSTGIQVNGPDLERLVNLVSYSGGDEALPDLDPVEVTQTDAPSSQRYGPQSFGVDQLFTRDAGQLAQLGARVLAMRAEPRVWIESLSLSPIADPDAAAFCAAVDFGDRLEVSYRHPLGWGWTAQVQVHGISYRLLPSGERNVVAEWSTTLTMDDVTYWEGAGWDVATWDDGTWTDPATSLEAA